MLNGTILVTVELLEGGARGPKPLFRSQLRTFRAARHFVRCNELCSRMSYQPPTIHYLLVRVSCSRYFRSSDSRVVRYHGAKKTPPEGVANKRNKPQNYVVHSTRFPAVGPRARRATDASQQRQALGHSRTLCPHPSHPLDLRFENCWVKYVTLYTPPVTWDNDLHRSPYARYGALKTIFSPELRTRRPTSVGPCPRICSSSDLKEMQGSTTIGVFFWATEGEIC